MLPASRRLRRPEQFRAVGRRGRRAGRGTLVVHLLATGAGVPPQVGFTVGRTVGDAVTRNRVRRRLRHAAAELMTGAEPLLVAGDQVVVRATPPSATADHARLRADLVEGLHRARGGPTATTGSRVSS